MFHLFIATPEKIRFTGMVHSLIAPGSEGYFEILTNHVPLIASLIIGKVAIMDENHQKWLFAISGGVIEVMQNQVTLLADTAELASEIDTKRSQQVLRNLRDYVDSIEAIPADIKSTIRRAKNRLHVHEEYTMSR
ncbi:MAG: ATP synthase F1 subunit epsilon [Parachlamydiaceae bacterium]